MDTLQDKIKHLQKQRHKKGVNPNDWGMVHPNLVHLAFWHVCWADEHDLPVVFTSIIRQKIKGVSKTDIHAHGRAYDMSVIGWMDCEAKACEEEMNRVHEKIGAIGIKTGKSIACYLHGSPLHFHAQVRP